MKVKKEFDVKLGERIRKIRKQKDIKVWYIAEKTGLSDTFIYQVERGEKGISAENFKNIAEVLEADTDYLLFGNSDKYNDDDFYRLTGELDENEKELIIRRYYYEQKPAEIAVVLDIPKKQVENKLYYVRQKLKKMMENQEGELSYEKI